MRIELGKFNCHRSSLNRREVNIDQNDTKTVIRPKAMYTTEYLTNNSKIEDREVEETERKILIKILSLRKEGDIQKKIRSEELHIVNSANGGQFDELTNDEMSKRRLSFDKRARRVSANRLMKRI